MKRSNVLQAAVLAAAVMATSAILGACGGGGGGSAPAPPPKPKLSGTVASGGAHAGATIIVKDGSGNTRIGTSDSNGKYSIDTDGLTPPFFLVASTGTQTFYSVSADANTTTTVNITPLTDLIIKTWYDAQGVLIDTAFTDPTGSNVPPSPASVGVINSVVQNAVQLWLNQNCVTTDGINLISTPFTANSTCIDRVLDLTTITPGMMVISNGSVTQNSVLSAATGSMNIVTTTTNTSGDSSISVNGTVVPVQTAQQAALAGITTTINAFAAAVNSKSTGTVTAGDLQLYMDPDAAVKWGGYSQLQTAQQMAYFFKGSTVSFSNIMIKSMPTTTMAETVFKFTQSKGGQTNTQTIEFVFRKVGGSWLMSGNNRIAEIEVRALMVRGQGSSAIGGTNLSLEVNVNALRSAPATTSLTSAVITGGPWTSATLSYNGQNVAPWDNSLTTDSYSIYAFNPSTISGGEPFTITLTPTVGSQVTYTQTLNAITTEPIMIVSGLTGSTIADANLDSPQTVTWTLPKTFAISMVRLGTVANTSATWSLKCDDSGNQNVLGITATSATVTIPSTCQGHPTVSAEIYLQVFGINGELTSVYYTYDY